MARASTMVMAAFLALMLTACLPPVNRDGAQPLRTVAQVDLSRYAGKWFEIARFDHSFERGCAGVTAEYALNPDGTVRVLNTCRRGGLNGEIDTAEGTARVADPATKAQLKVRFSGFASLFEGDYWVIGLADDYSWALVGEPSGRFLWILARTPQIAPALRDELVAKLQGMGYDTSALIWVEQPSS